MMYLSSFYNVNLFGFTIITYICIYVIYFCKQMNQFRNVKILSYFCDDIIN